MLSTLDETLLHQAPLTFAQTHISDHRFFDRVWFGGHTRDHMHFILGLAVYKNTNTLDGYFVFIKDGKQHNLRVSRPLLPDPATMRAGPIALEIVKPFEVIRLSVAAVDGNSLAAELVFTATTAVSLEAPHQTRINNRLMQDYLRFDQLGRFNGWVTIDDQRVAVSDWFGARDHSWGVRPGMGGFEPATALARAGENPNDVGNGQVGFLVVALWFDTPSLAGYLMQTENGAGDILYSHGRIIRRNAAAPNETTTTSITHCLQFVANTRTSTGGVITAMTADGAQIEIKVQALSAPICYKGSGYDNGFQDERGLGVHRGVLLETDIYDLNHPEDVVLPDGRVIRPWHREAGAIVYIGGEQGMAHFPCISSGPIARYGLYGPTINKR